MMYHIQMFPLPPLPEQERIVAKIEELFTQLEAGKSALEGPGWARRYKASVLKAAMEGTLLGKGKVENGELPDAWQVVNLAHVLSKPLSFCESQHQMQKKAFLYCDLLH